MQAKNHTTCYADLRKSLGKNKVLYLEVFGYSMWPFLKPGDKIKVVKSKVKFGDIIVHQSRDRLIVHRLIRIKGNLFFTKGDHLYSLDMPFKKEKLLGKVAAINKKEHLLSSNFCNFLLAFISRMEFNLVKPFKVTFKFLRKLCHKFIKSTRDRKLFTFELFYEFIILPFNGLFKFIFLILKK